MFCGLQCWSFSTIEDTESIEVLQLLLGFSLYVGTMAKTHYRR
jgi:hypothetical protein